MVGGIYEDASSNIHAFGYRPTEMQAKWGAIGLTYMLWAGPGMQENFIYVPSGQSNITVYVDWDPTTKTWVYRAQQFSIPLPSGWTGYNESWLWSTKYYERRTVLASEDGRLWVLFQPTPPGDVLPYVGGTDTYWHATHVEQIGYWTSEYVYMASGGSGFPHGCGTIRPYDYISTAVGGHFDHALAFNASWCSDGTVNPKFVWPAAYIVQGTHPDTDGKVPTNVGAPYGARFWLDPSLTDADFNSLGITKEWMLQIARTLQTYGGIAKEQVATVGGAGGIITESIESINWNISQGLDPTNYPAGYQWPWIADGTTDDSDSDSTTYNAAFPASSIMQ